MAACHSEEYILSVLKAQYRYKDALAHVIFDETAVVTMVGVVTDGNDLLQHRSFEYFLHFGHPRLSARRSMLHGYHESKEGRRCRRRRRRVAFMEEREEDDERRREDEDEK